MNLLEIFCDLHTLDYAKLSSILNESINNVDAKQRIKETFNVNPDVDLVERMMYENQRLTSFNNS